MKFAFHCLAILLLIGIANAFVVTKEKDSANYKVVCYWGSWSFYRPGNGQFNAEDANPYLCTHMIYGFTKLNPDNTMAVYDPDLDLGDTDWHSGLPWGHGMYRRWNDLRDVNPEMKTLISVGGWNEGSDKYSVMVGNPGSRKAFVDSVVQFLIKQNFNGLDLDWEYPAMKAVGDATRVPGNPADKQNYILLLQELHQAFQPHGFILSSAVSAGKPTMDRAYDVKEMNKYLDIINVMSYDFHGGWDNHTAHNAPLHPRPNDIEIDKEFTDEYAINYWLELGADPKKLVMGMPLYGRTFTLASPNDYGIGAKTIGAGGLAGPITRLVGMLGYNEICDYLKSSNWKVYREDTQKIPYAVSGNQWVGYDDEQSIKDKVNFIKEKGLGGGMVWSIDTDDFRGLCGKGKYPLLKTISRELNGIDGPDPIIHEHHYTPTPPPGQTTKRPIDVSTGKTEIRPSEGTTETPSDFQCKATGFFADPKDKTIFHECIDVGGSKLKDLVYHCGQGTVYDPVHHVCTFP